MPKTRRRLSVEDWNIVRDLYATGSINYPAMLKRFGLAETAIRKRASRGKWPCARKVAKKVIQIRGKILEQQVLTRKKSVKPVVSQAKLDPAELHAVNWTEKGEFARNLAYEIAVKALKTLANSKEGLAIFDWKDAAVADLMVRRACGLEDKENSVKVNVNLALVNQRLASIQTEMPPDAPDVVDIQAIPA